MNIVRRTGVVVIGVAALIAGCTEVDQGGEDVGTARQAGGDPHTNGLDPAVANGCWDEVLGAMNMPLLASGELNTALPEDLLPGGKCEASLRYAYTCAGVDGSVLPLPEEYSEKYPPNLYSGGQLLATATGWTTGGLDNVQKQDVLTCMITLVNPFEGANVCLFGDHVTNGNCAGYTLEEAVFKARLTRTGVTFDVWPLDPTTLCPSSSAVDDALGHRLCNDDWESCSINHRTDLATACTEQNGAYDCGGPAIKTILFPLGFLSMYGDFGCNPPPQ